MQRLLLSLQSRPENLTAAPAAPDTSSGSRSQTGLSVHLPINALYVSGGPVEGEVELDFRQLRQDNAQEVRVRLRGLARTFVTLDKTTLQEDVHLVRTSLAVWRSGDAYPPPGSDVLRFPFSFQLPPNLPPSLHYVGGGGVVDIKYAVTAVAVRPGTFHRNRRVRVPLAVVDRDGRAHIRDRLLGLAAGTDAIPWRTHRTQENVRKGLWGNYGTVQVQLTIPDIPVLPLFAPIPFIIEVKTTSPPLTRAKADALPPGKPVFPPAPAEFTTLEFKLRRKLHIRANAYAVDSSSDVAVFTRDASVVSAARADPIESAWSPLHGADEKSADAPGTWVQRAAFRSSFRLACAHTFKIDNADSQFHLDVKVPIPGVGNNVHVKVPVVLTSGVDAPVPLDGLRPPAPTAGAGPPSYLDLPPSYWDAGDDNWDDDKA